MGAGYLLAGLIGMLITLCLIVVAGVNPRYCQACRKAKFKRSIGPMDRGLHVVDHEQKPWPGRPKGGGDIPPPSPFEMPELEIAEPGMDLLGRTIHEDLFPCARAEDRSE